MEIRAKLFGRSAQPGAGGDRWRAFGQVRGAAIPGQRVLHLQGVGAARRDRRDRGAGAPPPADAQKTGPAPRARGRGGGGGRRAATGETEARPQRNRQTLKLADHHAAIAAEVALRPDVTLDELRAWLLATHQVEASLGLMHKTLARLGLTRKKSRGGPRSRTAPTSPSGGPTGGPGKPR